jgi:hypothetical protein
MPILGAFSLGLDLDDFKRGLLDLVEIELLCKGI